MGKDEDENASVKKKEKPLQRKRGEENAKNERWCGKEGI